MAYFTPYIDTAGYHYPTYNDILAYIVQNAYDIFGQDIYLGNDSQDYQLMSIFARAVYDSYSAAALAYDSHSPATSVGTGLDAVVAINGIARKQATRSIATVTLTGNPGVTISNGMVSDTNGVLWNLPATVVIGDNGTVNVQATCSQYGQIVALPETIINIMTPQLGWTSVTNTEAATPGNVAETDAQLRARQVVSTAQPSASMLEGLEGALSAVAEVTRRKVYENDTSATDANGIPGHSICCVVEGGENQEVAETIFNRKPIGCGTFGTQSVPVTDSYGNTITVNFERPTYVDFDVQVNIKPLVGYDATNTPAMITGGIASYLDSLDIGDDLTVSMLWWAAMNTMNSFTTPTYSITSVTVARHGEALSTDDVVLAFNEVARSNTNYITVTAV